MRTGKNTIVASSLAATALASLLIGSACVAPAAQQPCNENIAEGGFMEEASKQNADQDKDARLEDSSVSTQSQAMTPDGAKQEQQPSTTAPSEGFATAPPASQPAQSSQSSQAHESSPSPSPQKQRVWVVDVAAQTKTVHHEATGHMEGGGVYTVCTSCGAELSSNADIDRHGDTVHAGSTFGWTDKVRPGTWVEDTPAWDETITIEEQGHWEYR